MSSVNANNTIQTKMQLWENNNKKHKWELALKVTGVALTVLVAGAFTAAMIALPFLVPPTLPVVLIACLAVPWGLCGLGSFVGNFFSIDYTNYSKKENAEKAIKEMQKEGVPLPLDHFKRFHRYGMISKQELEARKALKNDVKKYYELQNEKYGIKRDVARKNQRINALRGLDSNQTQVNKLKEEIEKRNQRDKTITEEMGALMVKFNEFAATIQPLESK